MIIAYLETLHYWKISAKSLLKEQIFKGIAFPTCISVNKVCGHNSPIEKDSVAIKEGYLVKIELGVHVDGFAASRFKSCQAWKF